MTETGFAVHFVELDERVRKTLEDALRKIEADVPVERGPKRGGP
jgi:hypothetical protein